MYRLALELGITKEVISAQKHPSCEKSCSLKRMGKKKVVKSKVAAKKWLQRH